MRKIHEISQFFLVAFCFFVNVFLVCSHSCRKTLLQSENATRKQTKMNEQKFHISQEMVLLVVIGIRNVDLMRIKTKKTLNLKTPREKPGINNKLSRNEKQGPEYNPTTMVGRKTMKYYSKKNCHSF